MKIVLSDIDQENFRIDPHEVAGETCYLVQPVNIGAKYTKNNLIFRSSIWNAQGEPVSLSFPKFVNWGEKPEVFPTPKSLKGCELIEKLDGSTLIVSKYKGQVIARTRGTSDATQLDNGHEIEWLKDKYPKVFDFGQLETCKYSYLYEWVSPVNKIVINYGEDPDLYLIGIINHEDYSMESQTMLDAIAVQFGVKRPKRYAFDSIEDMLVAVEAFKGVEGICLYSKSGQEIHKIKGAWYLALHRMKSELGSYERVVDFYFSMNRPTYQEYYDFIVKNYDFELAEQVRGSISRICEGMKEVDVIIVKMKEKAESLKSLTRKDAAAIILQAYGETNRAGMVFKLLDSKPLTTDDVKKLLYQVNKV